MKILVTGGAGFVGRYLCKYLLSRGDDVVVVDNLITSDTPVEFRDNRRFKMYGLDIAAIRNDSIPFAFEQVYHLASPTSPKQFKKYPIETIKANVQGSLNVLDMARRYDARVLLVSTAHENANNCYTDSKRIAESLFINYGKTGVSTAILRMFNAYGPGFRKDDGRVIPEFIQKALRGEDISVWGNGGKRSFMHVSDAVRGIVSAMDRESFIGPVSIGGESVLIEDLAMKIVAFLGSKSNIIVEQSRGGDVIEEIADNTEAEETLGWSPCVSLDDGLLETIKYFKEV